MQDSHWHLDTTFKDDDNQGDVPQPKSPEELVDQFGIRTALLVLAVGLFIAAMWVISLPTFEKCSAVANPVERHACYDRLRDELLKPPAR
jgi:hypothetical protein